jgi:hypothetical protein
MAALVWMAGCRAAATDDAPANDAPALEPLATWFTAVAHAGSSPEPIAAAPDGSGGAIVTIGTQLARYDGRGTQAWATSSSCAFVGAIAQADGTFVATGTVRHGDASCPVQDPCMETISADGRGAISTVVRSTRDRRQLGAAAHERQFAVAGIAHGSLQEICDRRTDYNERIESVPDQNSPFVAGPPQTWADVVPSLVPDGSGSIAVAIATSSDGETCLSGILRSGESAFGTSSGSPARWVARLGTDGTLRFVHVFAQASATNQLVPFLVAATADGRCTVAGALASALDLGALGVIAPPSLPVVVVDASGPIAAMVISTDTALTVNALSSLDRRVYAAVGRFGASGMVNGLGVLSTAEEIIELVDATPTRIIEGFEGHAPEGSLVTSVIGGNGELVVSGHFDTQLVVGTDPAHPDATLTGSGASFVGVVTP